MNKAGVFIFLTILLPVFGCLIIGSHELLDIFFLPRYIFLSLFLIISILWLLYNKWKGLDFSIPWRSPITILLLLWLSALGFSVLNASNRSEWLIEIQKVFLYFTAFLVFASFLNGRREFLSHYFLKASIIICIVIILIGIYHFYHYDGVISEMGMMHVTSLMSNKNLFSEYISLCLPFLIAGIFKLNKGWKIGAIITSIAVLAFIIMLLARSAWVALTISLILIVLLVLIWNKRKKMAAIQNRKKNYAVSIGIILSVILFILMVDYFSGNVFSQRVISIFETDKGTASGRLQIWSRTIEMIKTSFFTGVGGGNWKLIFQSRNIVHTESTYTTEPLNDYIGIFAECGLFGFIAYTGMFLTGITQYVRQIFSEQNKIPVFYLAALASLIIYAVISCFSFPKDRIEHSVFFIFLLAFSCKDLSPEFKSKKLLTGSLLIIILTGLIFCGWSGSQRYIAEKYTRLALEARNRQNWKAVIKNINKAESPYYTLDPTTTPVLWYRGVAYYSLGKTDLAFTDFLSAYKANHFHIHVINNLATSYELKGDHDRAIELYKEALDVNPYFLDAMVNITAVLYNLKRYDEGIALLKKSPVQNNLIKDRIRVLQNGKMANRN